MINNKKPNNPRMKSSSKKQQEKTQYHSLKGKLKPKHVTRKSPINVFPKAIVLIVRSGKKERTPKPFTYQLNHFEKVQKKAMVEAEQKLG